MSDIECMTGLAKVISEDGNATKFLLKNLYQYNFFC